MLPSPLRLSVGHDSPMSRKSATSGTRGRVKSYGYLKTAASDLRSNMEEDPSEERGKRKRKRESKEEAKRRKKRHHNLNSERPKMRNGSHSSETNGVESYTIAKPVGTDTGTKVILQRTSDGKKRKRKKRQRKEEEKARRRAGRQALRQKRSAGLNEQNTMSPIQTQPKVVLEKNPSVNEEISIVKMELPPSPVLLLSSASTDNQNKQSLGSGAENPRNPASRDVEENATTDRAGALPVRSESANTGGVFNFEFGPNNRNSAQDPRRSPIIAEAMKIKQTSTDDDVSESAYIVADIKSVVCSGLPNERSFGYMRGGGRLRPAGVTKTKRVGLRVRSKLFSEQEKRALLPENLLFHSDCVGVECEDNKLATLALQKGSLMSVKNSTGKISSVFSDNLKGRNQPGGGGNRKKVKLKVRMNLKDKAQRAILKKKLSKIKGCIMHAEPPIRKTLRPLDTNLENAASAVDNRVAEKASDVPKMIIADKMKITDKTRTGVSDRQHSKDVTLAEPSDGALDGHTDKRPTNEPVPNGDTQSVTLESVDHSRSDFLHTQNTVDEQQPPSPADPSVQTTTFENFLTEFSEPEEQSSTDCEATRGADNNSRTLPETALRKSVAHGDATSLPHPSHAVTHSLQQPFIVLDDIQPLLTPRQRQQLCHQPNFNLVFKTEQNVVGDDVDVVSDSSDMSAINPDLCPPSVQRMDDVLFRLFSDPEYSEAIAARAETEAGTALPEQSCNEISEAGDTAMTEAESDPTPTTVMEEVDTCGVGVDGPIVSMLEDEVVSTPTAVHSLAVTGKCFQESTTLDDGCFVQRITVDSGQESNAADRNNTAAVASDLAEENVNISTHIESSHAAVHVSIMSDKSKLYSPSRVVLMDVRHHLPAHDVHTAVSSSAQGKKPGRPKGYKVPQIQLSTTSLADTSDKSDSDSGRMTRSRNRGPSKHLTLKKMGNFTEIVITVESVRKQRKKFPRREYNYFGVAALRELFCALASCASDDTCKAVLLSSVGPIFSSGLNPVKLLNWNGSLPQSGDIMYHLKRVINALIKFPKPLIAAVQGPAVGFGASLLLFCDGVYASERANFHWPYAKIGLAPFGCVSTLLPQTVGRVMARSLLLGGKVLTSNEAKACGLVTEVFPHDSFMANTLSHVREWCAGDSGVLLETKQMLSVGNKEDLHKANDRECNFFRKCQESGRNTDLLQSHIDSLLTY